MSEGLMALEWERVGEAIKLWPGASRLAPAAVAEYVRALRSHTGPVEAEQALDELRLEQNARPSIAEIVATARRGRLRRGLSELELETADPPRPWVLAHVIAVGSPVAPMMRVIADRHGIRPDEHRPEACELCIAAELEAAKLEQLEVTFGPDWLRIEQARDEFAAFSHELDRRFDWRVPTEAR